MRQALIHAKNLRYICTGGNTLINMGVVIYVVFTIAVVTITPGTVAELQIGMADIGSATNRATVVVIGFCCFLGNFHAELDDFVALGLGILSKFSLELDTPALREQIQHVRTEEEEIIGKRNYTKQIGGERKGEQIQYNNGQIDQTKQPGFYWDNEEKQKSGIRIHGGITKEQTQVQIGHMGKSAENHAVNIHHSHTGKIE